MASTAVVFVAAVDEVMSEELAKDGNSYTAASAVAEATFAAMSDSYTPETGALSQSILHDTIVGLYYLAPLAETGRGLGEREAGPYL